MKIRKKNGKQSEKTVEKTLEFKSSLQLALETATHTLVEQHQNSEQKRLNDTKHDEDFCLEIIVKLTEKLLKECGKCKYLNIDFLGFEKKLKSHVSLGTSYQGDPRIEILFMPWQLTKVIMMTDDYNCENVIPRTLKIFKEVDVHNFVKSCYYRLLDILNEETDSDVFLINHNEVAYELDMDPNSGHNSFYRIGFEKR